MNEVELFHSLSVGNEYTHIRERRMSFSGGDRREIVTLRVTRKTAKTITLVLVGAPGSEQTYRLTQYGCGGLPACATSDEVVAQQAVNRRCALIARFERRGYFDHLTNVQLDRIEEIVNSNARK